MNSDKESNKLTFNLVGVIFIAPFGTNNQYWNTQDWMDIDIPILNIYGERDHSSEVTDAQKYLGLTQQNKDIIILNADKARMLFTFICNH